MKKICIKKIYAYKNKRVKIIYAQNINVKIYAYIKFMYLKNM